MFLFLLLGLLTVLAFRVVYSVPIEFNGESIRKWEVGRQLVDSGQWQLLLEDHHQLRWSVVIPQLFVGWTFPNSWFGYYITPIAFWSLFAVACLGFFRKERHSLSLGMLFLVVIAVEPLDHAMASQVNSGAFGLLYVVCGIYALLAYDRTTKWTYLFLTSLAFFFAYGAHLTYAVFFGAPILFLFFNRRDFKGIVLFLLMLAALLGLEALILSMMSGGEVQGGRFAEIARMKTWGSIDPITGIDNTAMGSTRWKGAEPYSVHHFFDRWRMLPKYSLMAGVMFIVATGALMSPRLRKEMPNGVWLCFFAAGIYGVAVSAPIIGFQPLQLALDLHSRYLAPFFPLAAVFVVWVLGAILQNILGKRAGVFLGFGSVLLFSVFVVGSINYRCTAEISSTDRLGTNFTMENLYCRVFRYTQEQVIYPSPNVFALRADQYYSAFADDYVSGKVALYGHTRIGAFRWFVRAQYPGAELLETPNGWFSIDGEDKPMCVKELGQFATPEENYRGCSGQEMKPGVIEG
ncbi:hypothetical protein N9444_00880 [Gammaproteobacteria bacterium]|nr:hypothetical protein [Gammaproteobacteria bacterium]